MKLYKVILQDESDFINEYAEILLTIDANQAIEKAYEKIKDACEKNNIVYNKEHYSISSIDEIREIDGYEIIVQEKKYYAKGSNYFN